LISIHRALLARKSEVSSNELQILEVAVEKWQSSQVTVMSAMADLLPVPEEPNVLTDPTHLPSDFPVDVIAKRGLLDLLKQEVTLWHAYLRGRILDVRSVVQLLDAALHAKGEVRGQHPNTRMNTMYIDPIES
jgi:hypothetical protein